MFKDDVSMLEAVSSSAVTRSFTERSSSAAISEIVENCCEEIAASIS